MTVPEKAVQWAVNIANDNSHGYDQGNRWGPDYDCSSLVISAYKAAGVPLTCTYTGNMRSDMLLKGFVPAPVTLATGAGLQPGDVLLNEVSHTAMYIGNGQLVQASINERGSTTGGQTGDQTGTEISVRSYYNFPWDMALRYVRKEESTPTPTPAPTPAENPGTYTVKSGDTLWGIAERFLGNGAAYPLIVGANNLTGSMIYPGQVLVIPGAGTEKQTKTFSITTDLETYETLDLMAKGWGKTIGEVVTILLEESK